MTPYDDDYADRLDDARREEAEDEWRLPPATRRCWDCGVGSGPCVCTPEYAAWERAEEERADAEGDE